MEEGEIVIKAIPQSDGQEKPRPVLLLKQFPPHGDWLAVGLTTKLHRATSIDIPIGQDHPDLPRTGLPKPSLIRTGFFARIPDEELPGSIGEVSHETLQEVVRNLVNHLEKG